LRQGAFSNATTQLEHIATLFASNTNTSYEEQQEMENLLAFYELSIALAQQQGGMYSADSLQLIQLNEIASTPTLAGRQAKAIIQFRNEEQPYFNGEEAYFPKSMTAEEGHDLLTVGEIASLFDVFPNPAQDEVTIRVKDIEQTYSIIITDINGKIMSIHSEITDFIQLDITQLSNGTYLIHLVDGETRIETKKLVKM
ncbi:MAG: T9SS type A sorting domain-containing protein, partial [Crocinitomicaceae bacterium]|nr:T9SS type A sorting domain-containing protein [Crocinitomicaceae bacterium]